MTMSEHAFDPIPDEQAEPVTTATAGTEWIPSDADVPPEPNATVTVKQLRDAIESGRWAHDEPTTALWLNTSFPPAGREASEMIVELTAHGIACS
jgi:hypothetical protein